MITARCINERYMLPIEKHERRIMFKFDTGAQNTVLSINKLNQDLNDKQVEVIASTVKTRYVHQFRAAVLLLEKEVIKVFMTDKEDYIGSELTWGKAVELFPDKWVSFKNCVYEGIEFKKGILVDVIEDANISDYLDSNWEQGYYTNRTTEGVGVGYNCGRIYKKEVT